MGFICNSQFHSKAMLNILTNLRQLFHKVANSLFIMMHKIDKLASDIFRGAQTVANCCSQREICRRCIGLISGQRIGSQFADIF